jgi:hypothetical protein
VPLGVGSPNLSHTPASPGTTAPAPFGSTQSVSSAGTVPPPGGVPGVKLLPTSELRLPFAQRLVHAAIALAGMDMSCTGA